MKSVSKKISFLLLLGVIPLFFYFLTIQKKQPAAPVKHRETTREKENALANPYLEQMVHDYDSAFRELMRIHGTPGASVAIIHDTTIILLQGYGVKQLGTKDSVDSQTVFRLASVSKPFASLLTGILTDKGVLHWDDPVIRYWPEFRLKNSEQAKEITLRHILSHSTGLPYHTYTNMIEERLSFDTLLSSLRDVSLVSKPGQLYSYQNVGYSIIGKVIERATGESYQQQLKKHIFEPLGMMHASCSYIDLLSSGNMAHPHQFRKGKLRTTFVNDTYYNVAPAGGINASAYDMAQWMKALVGSRTDIVPKAVLDSVYTPQVLANSRNRNFYEWQRVQKAHYALGWRVLQFANDTLLYHGGYVTGYRSEVAIHPKDKIAICVLTNAAGRLADVSVPVFFKVYEKYREPVHKWHMHVTTNF
jgi:beta-lactamase class C